MRRSLVIVGISLLALTLGRGVRAGEPLVYPSSNGTPPVSLPVLVAPQDGQTLVLYIAYQEPGGTASGSGRCANASGIETCGFDVLLEMVTDTARFADFDPADAQRVVGKIDPSGTKLRVNGLNLDGALDAAASGLIPAAIGSVTLDAAGANDLQIQVKGTHWVGAAGQLEAIQEQVIVDLPEPSALTSLAFGALLLVGLARRRGRAGLPGGSTHTSV